MGEGRRKVHPPPFLYRINVFFKQSVEAFYTWIQILMQKAGYRPYARMLAVWGHTVIFEEKRDGAGGRTKKQRQTTAPLTGTLWYYRGNSRPWRSCKGCSVCLAFSSAKKDRPAISFSVEFNQGLTDRRFKKSYLSSWNCSLFCCCLFSCAFWFFLF